MVVYAQAALCHHFFQISVAEREGRMISPPECRPRNSAARFLDIVFSPYQITVRRFATDPAAGQAATTNAPAGSA
jgi:hypothetical protein